MANSSEIPEILHTEEIKKRYSEVERNIKRCLTELFLLNNIGHKNNICRGFSITKDFKIRELTPEENSKYLSNPSTIKSDTLKNTAADVKKDLISMIKSNVQEESIAEKYIEGIEDFFDRYHKQNKREFIESGRKSLNYLRYLRQSKKVEGIGQQNVRFEVAKVLFDKFGDESFEEKSDKVGAENLVVLSKKSLDYLYVLFFNANKVRESWGKRVDQVFHDGDFSFITTNVKGTESDYIDVIVYLVDKTKFNYYGRRDIQGQNEWSRKTSQYADILRALSNDQLGINKMNLGEENPEFQRDDTVNKLYLIGGGLLENIVVTHNRKKTSNKLEISKRLKSLPSCVEKIIEGKKINDTIGLRLSMLGIGDQNFDEIKEITERWFQTFEASLAEFPQKYVPKGQTIKIKSVTIDNKGVLNEDQLDRMISGLKEIISVKKREASPSPYISLDKWKEEITKHYPEVVEDPAKREILKSFYNKISRGKNRGRNGGYKDFKFNIVFEVDNEQGESIGEKTMEVQFDDINNGKGLSNYNIRNFERGINTQSRLSFSVPLSEVRKRCEKNLKEMNLRAGGLKDKIGSGATQEFFIIPVDKSEINISSFSKRDNENSEDLDSAIIKIINYFLQKGTFVLCDTGNIQWGDPTLKTKLLTVQDLHNVDVMKNLHICSSLELAAQQHSYLQQGWDRKVGIYLPEKQKIGWISLKEVMNPMNLGKKIETNKT